MPDDLDLPIALRRTRRRSSVVAATAEGPSSTARTAATAPSAPCLSAAKHPRNPSGGSRGASDAGRTKRKKRVRFSDPGPATSSPARNTDEPCTGLTPMIRRTSLGVSGSGRGKLSSGTPIRRRHSTPARRTSGDCVAEHEEDSSPHAAESHDQSLTFLPLRQVLSGRVQRRIRRNGLSEEMNRVHAAERADVRRQREELNRLRGELERRDEELGALKERELQRQRETQLRGLNGSTDDDTIEMDTDRVWDLELEVSELRRELRDAAAGGRALVAASARLRGHRTPTSPTDGSSSPVPDWTLAARDPFAAEDTATVADDEDEDDFMDMDGGDFSHFGDATEAELAVSTPTRRRPRVQMATVASGSKGKGTDNPNSSFPTPPATSPAPETPTTPGVEMQPLTPSSHRSRHYRAGGQVPRTPQSHSAGVQVRLIDHVQHELLAQSAESMRRELDRLGGTLAGYAALAGRIGGKVRPFVSAQDGENDGSAAENESSPPLHLEGDIDALLRQLADRTAALQQLSSAIGALGFSPTDGSPSTPSTPRTNSTPHRQVVDPSAILTSLASAFRAARLELEYTSPGESTLPLSAPAAQVLDAVLSRLRELATRTKSDEACIDEYHALELSLRQQLSARVEAMDELRAQVASLGEQLGVRERELSEGEVSRERLKGAVESYRRDVKELEELVGRMEEEQKGLKERLEGEVKVREELQAQFDQRPQQQQQQEPDDQHAALIASLESKLTAAETQCVSLTTAISEAESRTKKQVSLLNRSHGKALALRDARVTELRGEVERVNAALRRAHENVRRLRVDNARADARLLQLEVRVVEAERERDEAAREVEGLLAHANRADAGPQRKGKGSERETSAPPTFGGAGASASRRSSVERETVPPSPLAKGAVLVKPVPGGVGGMLAGELARRASGATKKRRRYDSGLGFLDEDDMDMLEV